MKMQCGLGSDKKNIRFSLEKFALVTGLDYSPSYEPDTENNNDDYTIVNEFLDENCAITTQELHTKFLRAKSNDDMKMVKLAMLYFVESVLLGNENRNHINETNILLVDNFIEFNEFPWGRISFKMTIDSLRKCVAERVAKPKKKSTADSKYKGTTYSVHGFTHAFMVWAYEAVSVIGDKCTKRYDDLFPRILRWKSTKPKEFEEIQMKVLNKKASRMIFIEKLHTTGDVEANKHYISYFSEDEWLQEIGEENDNAIESDSHPEENPSHEDNESHDSELNSFDGIPDDSYSNGAPTFNGSRTLLSEHLNESVSIPTEVTKKKGGPFRHASGAFDGSILEEKVNHLGCRIQNIEENIAKMENTMKNIDTKIDNIEGKIDHINVIDNKLRRLIQLLEKSLTSEPQGVDFKPMNDLMDVASGQSPMQQSLETLVNICSTENATDMMTPDDSHGTEEDPIIVSSQEKDCRLMYNLRKRKDMKTSTYLWTPYTNHLKKPRETTDVEVHPQETKSFEVCPLIL